jgi:hypothetical protein
MYNPVNYTITKHWYQVNTQYVCWKLIYINLLDNTEYTLVIQLADYLEDEWKIHIEKDSTYLFNTHPINADSLLSGYNMFNPFKGFTLLEQSIDVIKSIALRMLDYKINDDIFDYNYYIFIKYPANNDTSKISNLLDNGEADLAISLMNSQDIDILDVIEYLPLGIMEHSSEYIHYITYIWYNNKTLNICCDIMYYEDIDYFKITWYINVDNDWKDEVGTIEELLIRVKEYLKQI